MTRPVHLNAHHVRLSAPGSSAAYPRVEVLPDGRLVAAVTHDVAWDYFVGGRWTVLVSDDGDRWEACDDPSVPFNWPGSSTRERHDRATLVQPDGTWLATGVVGWQAWPESEAERARAEGRYVTPTAPPGLPGTIGVGTNTFFVQKSADGGRSWTRREVELPSAGWTLGLPRNLVLADGTVILPARQRSRDAQRGQFLAIRVTPGEPDRIRVHPVPRDLDGVTGSEAALADLGGDRVLMLMRADATRGGDGRLLASHSEDGGRTWTLPLATDLWGRPPHLLTLADGRLLATYGHQREPFGIMAALSTDGGETWDVERRLLLAVDDQPEQGVGYHPLTVQRADGSLYTCYYRLRHGVSEAHAVAWTLPS